MKIDYETDYDVGQDNVQVMGMDMHNPVFFISAVPVSYTHLTLPTTPYV